VGIIEQNDLSASTPISPSPPRVVPVPLPDVVEPAPTPIPARCRFLPQVEIPTKYVHKPSTHVLDLLEGRGSTSNCPSNPIVPRRIRFPEHADKPAEFE
jgi:hypothetical protein